MHVFEEGQQYALSTEGESNISLFFVKLTDSALQSIEMYLSSQGDSALKPTIQFQDNSGTISLPINDQKHNYGFTLSKIETDGLQASFYCFQHTCKRSLKSLGIMLNRMYIHAKDDSYEKTKFKMEAAEKEQKSFRTKEIKLKGTHLSHKFKRPERLSSPEKFYPTAKKAESVNLNPKNKFSYSAVSRQPIRKRIIHILAIKPYKKPELLLRLIREGIIDRDKKNLNSVLSSVGILKGNVYNLASNLWNEVEENWEFCTKEEIQLIQRRKQQFLKPSTDKEVPSSKSQNNCSVIQNISTEPIIEENEPINKKRRISHSGLKITDQVISDNSSASKTSSKPKLPAVGNFKSSHDKHLQVNGNCNGAGQKSKTDSLVSCAKDFLSTCKLGNFSDQNHISGPSHDKSSSKKQTVCNFKLDESKHRKLKKNQKQASVNNNCFNLLPQIGTFIPSLSESDSHSKVQVKNHLANSEYKGEKSRFEYSVTNLCANKTSHTNTSMVSRSKVISPVSCSNSSDSSLYNKDSKNYVGYVEDTQCIVDLIPEMDCSSSSIQMYTTVVSKKQRSQYAKEFNIQYEEYLKLHAQMKDISEKFMNLENSLLQCEEGSSEFKKIRAEIQEESECTLQTSDYICAWNKFNSLQSKLSLIKRLIKEYDSSQGRDS